MSNSGKDRKNIRVEYKIAVTDRNTFAYRPHVPARIKHELSFIHWVTPNRYEVHEWGQLQEQGNKPNVLPCLMLSRLSNCLPAKADQKFNDQLVYEKRIYISGSLAH